MPEPLAGDRPARGASAAWRATLERIDLDEYDARWDQLAARGEHVHGEADFVMSLHPHSVLDAGCGTGRVAIELARRGVDVVGVDGDPDMLERARRRAPELTWVESNLAALDLGRTFDVVVLAGNVVPFVDAADRAAAVAGSARHVAPVGRLVSGASLRADWPTAAQYDAWCAAAGFTLVDRFATWNGDPWTPAADYAVSVHQPGSVRSDSSHAR